jgi:L,D-transpeptidase YcbB
MEVTIHHAQPSYGRPPATLPPGVAGVDSGYASGGGSGRGFFETLFGIPSAPPPPQRPQRRVPQRQAAN